MQCALARSIKPRQPVEIADQLAIAIEQTAGVVRQPLAPEARVGVQERLDEIAPDARGDRIDQPPAKPAPPPSNVHDAGDMDAIATERMADEHAITDGPAKGRRGEQDIA